MFLQTTFKLSEISKNSKGKKTLKKRANIITSTTDLLSCEVQKSRIRQKAPNPPYNANALQEKDKTLSNIAV